MSATGVTGPVRWTGPTNRPGTPDSWSGDVVTDARYVLGENASGNSVAACLLREVEALRARLAEVTGLDPEVDDLLAPGGCARCHGTNRHHCTECVARGRS